MSSDSYVCWVLSLVFIASCASLLAAPSPNEAPPSSTAPDSSLRNEDPCLREGGLCLRSEECPDGQLSPLKGLCPSQQAAGVECCHGLSRLEHRCSARGGICRPKSKCGRQLWEERADDCKQDEKCCILVAVL